MRGCERRRLVAAAQRIEVELLLKGVMLRCATRLLQGLLLPHEISEVVKATHRPNYVLQVRWPGPLTTFVSECIVHLPPCSREGPVPCCAAAGGRRASCWAPARPGGNILQRCCCSAPWGAGALPGHQGRQPAQRAHPAHGGAPEWLLFAGHDILASCAVAAKSPACPGAAQQLAALPGFSQILFFF